MTKPAAIELANEKPAPINNTELVETFRSLGGKIVHILPRGNRRGMTFAFKLKGSRIELATSVQHRSDTFTKKLGTKTAIEHFLAGKTVFFPLNNTVNPVAALRWMADDIR